MSERWKEFKSLKIVGSANFIIGKISIQNLKHFNLNFLQAYCAQIKKKIMKFNFFKIFTFFKFDLI